MILAAPLAVLQESTSALSSTGLRWIDITGLVLVVLLGLLGAWRGLWWQVFRLVGMFAAVAVARAVTPRLLPAVSDALPELDPRIANGVVFVLLFVAVLLLAALIGKLGRKSLEAMQLSTVDRVGGLVAGAVTGLLLHLALVTAIDHFGPEEWSQDTLGETVSQSVYQAIGAELPKAYAGDDEAR